MEDAIGDAGTAVADVLQASIKDKTTGRNPLRAYLTGSLGQLFMVSIPYYCYFQNPSVRAYFALVLGLRGGCTSGGRLPPQDGHGSAPVTPARSTYRDVVPASDGVPLVPQEIAFWLALVALDDAVALTGGVMIRVGHRNPF